MQASATAVQSAAPPPHLARRARFQALAVLQVAARQRPLALAKRAVPARSKGLVCARAAVLLPLPTEALLWQQRQGLTAGPAAPRRCLAAARERPGPLWDVAAALPPPLQLLLRLLLLPSCSVMARRSW